MARLTEYIAEAVEEFHNIEQLRVFKEIQIPQMRIIFGAFLLVYSLSTFGACRVKATAAIFENLLGLIGFLDGCTHKAHMCKERTKALVTLRTAFKVRRFAVSYHLTPQRNAAPVVSAASVTT